MVVLQQILQYEIIGGTLPMCQNTTMRANRVWIKRYYALCSKTYNTLQSCNNFPAGSRQTARGARICETSLLSKAPTLWIHQWHPHMLVFICAKYEKNPSLIRHLELQGAISIRKTVLPGMAIPMLKIRRPNGRLIFNMEITIRR